MIEREKREECVFVIEEENSAIDWIFDVDGNIVLSRLNHFIDEARLTYDKYDSMNVIWYEKFGSQALDILTAISKNPMKIS